MIETTTFRKLAAASRVILLVVGLGLAALSGGCTQVPVYQQVHVSKTGMLFSDSLVASPRPNLVTQIEPGSAASGGAQAAGCTACR